LLGLSFGLAGMSAFALLFRASGQRLLISIKRLAGRLRRSEYHDLFGHNCPEVYRAGRHTRLTLKDVNGFVEANGRQLPQIIHIPAA
jgi:hypothetical protein